MNCPNCKSENVARILRGLPEMIKISQKDIDEGKIVPGGYLVGEDDPEWRCNDCGNKWIAKKNGVLD